jgi:hypothetical protein
MTLQISLIGHIMKCIVAIYLSDVVDVNDTFLYKFGQT